MRAARRSQISYKRLTHLKMNGSHTHRYQSIQRHVQAVPLKGPRKQKAKRTKSRDNKKGGEGAGVLSWEIFFEEKINI